MATRQFFRIKPTKAELRAAALYTRRQFKIMFPHHKPQRREGYRRAVYAVAAVAAFARSQRGTS
jgi:hypothetical protein